jgi:hypothetical protein
MSYVFMWSMPRGYKWDEGITHNHVYLPPLVSIDATGIYIPNGNSEVLLAAVYKAPCHAWNDVDITEL